MEDMNAVQEQQPENQAVREHEDTRKTMIRIVVALVLVVAVGGVALWLLSPKAGQADGSADIRFVKPPASLAPSPLPGPAETLQNDGTLANAQASASPGPQSNASPLEAMNQQPIQAQAQASLVLIVDGDKTRIENRSGNPVPDTQGAVPAAAQNEDEGPAKILGQSEEGAKAPAATQKPKAAKAQASPKPAKAAKTAAPAAAVTSASKAGRQYWIQIFSSPNRDRAEQVQKDLAALGFKGRISTRSVNGKDFYRLRYGPYNQKDEANKFLGWVKQIKGYEASYVSEEKTE